MMDIQISSPALLISRLGSDNDGAGEDEDEDEEEKESGFCCSWCTRSSSASGCKALSRE
jgi:hypothetical protein